jgi:hypothetical protein
MREQNVIWGHSKLWMAFVLFILLSYPSNKINKQIHGIALSWALTQHVVVIPYRRFGISYQSQLQGS